MAQGMRYPKTLPKEIQLKIGDTTRTVSDALAYLSITPYFGFWGVDEVLPIRLGHPTIAYVRTIAKCATRSEAQTFIEGFLAGEQKQLRKTIAEIQAEEEAKKERTEVNDD